MREIALRTSEAPSELEREVTHSARQLGRRSRVRETESREWKAEGRNALQTADKPHIHTGCEMGINKHGGVEGGEAMALWRRSGKLCLQVMQFNQGKI